MSKQVEKTPEEIAEGIFLDFVAEDEETESHFRQIKVLIAAAIRRERIKRGVE